MKKYLILIFTLFPFLGFSQLDITVTSNIIPLYPADGDTLSACRDSLVIFEAEVTDGGVPVEGAFYEWDLDNDVKPYGTDVDSIAYEYTTGGGYRVKLKVTKDADEWFTIVPIKIAMEPNYSETKTGIDEEHDGICMGSSASLLGKAYPEIWEDEPAYEFIESSPNYFEFDDNYSSHLPFDEFALDAVFSSGNIDSVGLEILHADMGDLQITLSCENGNSVILKNYEATNHALLGDTATEVNEPYTYYWSPSASITMNSATTSNNIVPESAYLPEGSFDVLNGCPLNGNWTIEINDNQEADSGFVYSWNIVFHEDILPDIWTFRDTLIQYKEINGIPYPTYWSGNNAGAGSIIKVGDTITANTLAAPDTYGNHNYKLNVITNWGCPQDTTIELLVEKPSFSYDPTEVFEKDTVKFTDETSWSFERFWDFGDKSSGIDISDTSHVYLEQNLDGYKAIITTIDKNGCSDTVSMIIVVKVEPTVLANIPNMFSPARPADRDGKNDFFKIPKKSLAGMKEFSIKIYNRWGDKVFESNSVEEMNDEGWDGSIMNRGITMASPGIYFYVIKAYGKDENDYKNPKNPDKIDLTEKNVIYTPEVRGSIHLFR